MIAFKNGSIRVVIGVLMIALVFSCKPIYDAQYQKVPMVDSKLTRSTVRLHKKITLLAQKGIVLGHQDSPCYGIEWKQDVAADTFDSDVRRTAGDFPGVYGFDLGHIELDSAMNLDSVHFSTMRKNIQQAYKKGGIITLSWHLDNPVTKGGSWDTIPAVGKILGDDVYQNKYAIWVTRLAEFVKSLKYKGMKIPVVLRPYHEMNGNWFWWGSASCTPSEYISLWRKTVHLLKNENNVHQILYAYSPNIVETETEFLRNYPGDAYVDILGIDIYDHDDSVAYVNNVQSNLKILGSIGRQKNKPFAFTETGSEKIPSKNWFTEILYPNIRTSGISWVLFWRNARKSHHYIPYPGHLNEADFSNFCASPDILLLNEVQTLGTK